MLLELIVLVFEDDLNGFGGIVCLFLEFDCLEILFDELVRGEFLLVIGGEVICCFCIGIEDDCELFLFDFCCVIILDCIKGISCVIKLVFVGCDKSILRLSVYV